MGRSSLSEKEAEVTYLCYYYKQSSPETPAKGEMILTTRSAVEKGGGLL